MKRLVIFSIIFIVFVAIASVVISFIVSSELKKEIIPEIIVERADFIKVGNLVPEGAAWRLIYEEPGKPALVAPLVFSDQSVCIGIGSTVCDPSIFNPGMRVSAEGTRLADGSIEVTRIAPSE